jgi:beta-glucanase (GH16 family)
MHPERSIIRRVVIAVGAAALVACGGDAKSPTSTVTNNPPPAPAKQAKWALDWADEFNGAALDTTIWIASDGPSNVNSELEYYTPTDVYLENGSLVLRSQRRTFGSRQYSSGEVRTGNNRTVHWGSAVEWRTQIPVGQGIWPANWLVGSSCDGLNGCASWPPEIDVMEIKGDAPDDNYMTHWWGMYPNQGHETSQYGASTLSSGYHAYRLEWFRDSVLWYIDGVQRAKHTANVTSGDLQLLMNTAVGGNFVGAPDATTVFPQYQRIDYVRVYRDTANVY